MIRFYVLENIQKSNMEIQSKVKVFLEEFYKEKKNVNTLLVFFSTSLLLLYRGADLFWFGVIVILLLVGLILEFVFKFPFHKSTLYLAGSTFLLVLGLILYASIRQVYFPNPKYSDYHGGYAPDGTICDYGFKRATGECCDEDDYSCEMCDDYGIYCDLEDVFQGEYFDIEYLPDKTSGGDYDCVDFRSWDEAQKVYAREGGLEKDPYNLDEDKDGKACEEFVY